MQSFPFGLFRSHSHKGQIHKEGVVEYSDKVATLDYGKITKNNITHSDLWSGPHKNASKNAKQKRTSLL